MQAIADQQLLKRLNRANLLRQLQRNPGLSRAQLAKMTGLTKSTVGLLARESLEEGWITAADTTQAQGLGRPATPLSLNAHKRLLLGVEIAIGTLRAVAVSLNGHVRLQREVAFADTTVAVVCALVAELVAQLLAEVQTLPQLAGSIISGLGVGLPGAFDDQLGVVRFAPHLGWRNVPFVSALQLALADQGLGAIELHIQNEADTAALSEYEFVPGRQASSLIFVTCDVGVGAGIVLNDQLFTGCQGMAGEIGHSILQPDGALCSCGRRGCAETFFGSCVLAQGQRTPQSAGMYLGLVLQNLWTTFNPAILILGGSSSVRYPVMVRSALQTLEQVARAAKMPPPRVHVAHYGLWAVAVGASALVLHHALRPWADNKGKGS